MKKLLIGVASAAMFLASVAPAFAAKPPVNNVAIVTGNVVSANSSTGNVSQLGGSFAGTVTQQVVTGNSGALAVQGVAANIGGEGNNFALVAGNGVGAGSSTGTVGQSGFGNGVSQYVSTGKSFAGAGQLAVVNVSFGR